MAVLSGESNTYKTWMQHDEALRPVGRTIWRCYRVVKGKTEKADEGGDDARKAAKGAQQDDRPTILSTLDAARDLLLQST